MARKPKLVKAPEASNNKSCIYKITNFVDTKIYIGSAFIFRKRKATHIHNLKKNKHSNKHLQHAWNKYGELSFLFEIIEECEKDKLIEREQYWIDILKPEYNICLIAGNTSGRKMSPEAIEKMRKRLIGLKRSKETKIKMSQSRKGIPRKKGYKHSKEVCEQISNSHKGKQFTDNHKASLSKARIGKTHSKETLDKIRQSALKREANKRLMNASAS